MSVCGGRVGTLAMARGLGMTPMPYFNRARVGASVENPLEHTQALADQGQRNPPSRGLKTAS